MSEQFVCSLFYLALVLPFSNPMYNKCLSSKLH